MQSDYFPEKNCNLIIQKRKIIFSHLSPLPSPPGFSFLSRHSPSLNLQNWYRFLHAFCLKELEETFGENIDYKNLFFWDLTFTCEQKHKLLKTKHWGGWGRRRKWRRFQSSTASSISKFLLVSRFFPLFVFVFFF